MEKFLDELLPILTVEHDCILSKQGDITVAFKVDLPEIFTLSDQEYEALHQIWVKAIKILPAHTVFHKQDWFIDRKYHPDFSGEDSSFLTRSSERYFNERPFLEHSCYVLLTKKPAGRKLSSSLLSNLIRPSIVPEQSISRHLLDDFLDSASQFKRILTDSGFVKIRQLTSAELESHAEKTGLIESYCFLSEDNGEPLLRDMEFSDGIKIGDQYCQLFTLGDASDLPSLPAQGSLMISTQPTAPNSASALPAGWGSYCPARISTTSIFFWKMKGKQCGGLKANGSDCNRWQIIRVKTRLRWIRPMLFKRSGQPAAAAGKSAL